MSLPSKAWYQAPSILPHHDENRWVRNVALLINQYDFVVRPIRLVAEDMGGDQILGVRHNNLHVINKF
ncbi:MAG: hypothetical protein ACLPXB_05755 [Thiobacillaceae bacterium]